MRRQPRYRQAIALLCLLLVACSDSAKLPLLPVGGSILAFGDSLTHGTGTDAAHSYPAQLQAITGYRVLRSGVPGETTAEGLQRLPRVLAKTRPDLVILCLGGNDFLRHQPLPATRSNLQAMLDLLKARHIPVLLLAVPKLGLGLHPVAMYAELAKANKIPVATGILSEVLSRRDLKSDAVHPNAQGYRRVAEALAKRLHQLGALP